MFTKVTDEKIMSIYRDCLENGLVSQEDANYTTEDRSLMLLVAIGDHYIEVYAYSNRIFRLDYLQNNIDWDEVVNGPDPMLPQNRQLLDNRVGDVYQEILERKGLRVIRDKKSKYLN
jgi:hypothetical protein